MNTLRDAVNRFAPEPQSRRRHLAAAACLVVASSGAVQTAPDPMLKLLIEDDEGRKTVVPLVRSEISIGRQDGNTIRLTERNVSRRHARIVREDDGRYYVEDTSRYGSRKNGKRFGGRTTLDRGDVLVIGDYKLALRDGDAAIDEPLVPAPSGPPPLPPAARGEASPDAATISMTRARAEDVPANRVGRLVCIAGPFAGGEFKVLGNEVVIGRAPDCDVVIEHPSVSKQHARILRESEEIFIEDLGSSNGITVNGDQRKRAALRNGDRIEIGGLEFRFATGEGPVPLAAPYVDDEPSSSGRGMAPFVIGGVVLVAIVGVGAYFALKPAPIPTETVTTAVDHASRAAFDEGQSHLNAARWDDAIAAFDRVAASSEHAELAASLRDRAGTEKANQAIYDDVVRLHEEGKHDDAFRRIADIPRGSYYRTRATDENLERRILGALIEARIAASNEAQRAGDLAQARAVLDDVRTIAPEDARLVTRLVELDAAEAGTAAPRQVAVAVTPPPADPRTAPAEPRTAPAEATPSERTPTPPATPPRATADAGARTEPEPVPPPNTDDTRARANDLKAAARRAGIQGNHQEAVRLLEEAAELNGGDAQINLMLFQNYRNLGNRNRAARALRRYLQQEPGDPRRAEYESWLAENAPE